MPIESGPRTHNVRSRLAVYSRLKKLELAMRHRCPPASLHSIQLKALDKLDYSDLMAIIHAARKCNTGEKIYNASELNEVVTRWRGAIASLLAQHAPPQT